MITRLLSGILAVTLLATGMSHAAGMNAPQNYQTTVGVNVVDVNGGIAAAAINTKAFGPGTTSGVDNTDPAFFKDAAVTKNVKITIAATGGNTAHNFQYNLSPARIFFASEPALFGWWIYTPESAKMQGCALLISADNFTNYYQVQMANTSGIRDGWNFFYAHKDDFTVGGGSPSWSSAMVQFRLQCTVLSGQTTTFYIGQNYVGYYARPKFVWTWDDDFGTLYSIAKPILDAKGWKGTLFVQGARIGASQYMTLAEHLALKAAGWELFNHTQDHSHFTGATDAAVEADIVAGETTMKAAGLWATTGSQHFAYPYGEFNANVKAILQRRGYVSARAVGGITLTPWASVKGAEFDLFQVETMDLSSAVSLAQAKTEVDQAIKYGQNLVSLVHALVASGAGGSSWVTSDYQALADYVQLKEKQGLIDVVQYGKMMEGLAQPTTLKPIGGGRITRP